MTYCASAYLFALFKRDLSEGSRTQPMIKNNLAEEPMYSLPNPYAAETGDAEVTILVDVQLKPGFASVIEQKMAETIAINRAEEGNVEFSFLKVRGKENAYVLFERWRNQAALDWHMEQPYTQEIFAVLENALAYPMTEVYEHIGFLRDLAPRQDSAIGWQ